MPHWRKMPPRRNPHAGVWLIIAFCAAMILVMFVLSLLWPVHARDLDGAHASAPLHEWFKNLKNGNGGLCCEEADGHRLEDVDWRGETDGSYSVRIDGQWIKLQDWQIVHEPNRLGSAVVWIFLGKVTCFMPGAGT